MAESSGEPTDWAFEIHAATSVVERWIERVRPDGWLQPGDAAWSNQDLLGHLTAWSDLLIDEVEALEQERCEAIQALDVDTWNADRVAERKHWSSDAIVDAWRRSARRAAEVIARLPAHAWSSIRDVPWADRPISIGDLMHLWLAHIEQHGARLRGQ